MYLEEARRIAAAENDRALEFLVTFEIGLPSCCSDLSQGAMAEMEHGVNGTAELSLQEREAATAHGVETAVGGIVLDEGMLVLHLAHAGRLQKRSLTADGMWQRSLD